MKIKLFVSLRPNHFIFIGHLKTRGRIHAPLDPPLVKPVMYELCHEKIAKIFYPIANTFRLSSNFFLIQRLVRTKQVYHNINMTHVIMCYTCTISRKRKTNTLIGRHISVVGSASLLPAYCINRFSYDVVNIHLIKCYCSYKLLRCEQGQFPQPCLGLLSPPVHAQKGTLSRKMNISN